MSLESLELAFKIIEKNKGYWAGEKPVQLVDKAEKFLGLNFPTTYRKFLLKFGCGSLREKEIYGISKDNFENASIPNGIWLTNDERQKHNLPKELVLIAQSIEGYYALNTSQMNKENECPVVDCIPTIPINKLEIIASDFGDFLLKYLTNEL